jgi:hypothetical protein
VNYWDDVGFAYQRPPGLINAPIRRDTRRKQLEEEQARRTYQGLLERDLIGIQQFSPFFGLNTRDPDAIPVAPMDVVPAGAIGKGVAGLIAAGTGGLLARQLMKQPVNRSSVSMMGYHGGPTKWAPEPDAPLGRPRLENVGQGEGAQAYGHGFYVAEDPIVGGTYQAKVSAMRGTEKPTVEGRPINWDDPVETAAFELERHKGNREAAAEFFERTFLPSTRTPRMHSAEATGVPEILRSGRQLPEVKLPGHLYKMDVPDADVAKMLDWDKPLSQQPENVQRVVKAWGGFPDTMKGSQIYESMASALAKPPFDNSVRSAAQSGAAKAASKYLASKGIPGLRYLDQGSRYSSAGMGPAIDRAAEIYNKTQDYKQTAIKLVEEFPFLNVDRLVKILPDALKNKATRNMVIWDDDLLKRIKVLERE